MSGDRYDEDAYPPDVIESMSHHPSNTPPETLGEWLGDTPTTWVAGNVEPQWVNHATVALSVRLGEGTMMEDGGVSTCFLMGVEVEPGVWVDYAMPKSMAATMLGGLRHVVGETSPVDNIPPWVAELKRELDDAIRQGLIDRDEC